MPHSPEESDKSTLRLQFQSNSINVRETLQRSRAVWSDWGFEADPCFSAEIVLAEALNNVVEHAHAGRQDGTVVLLNDLQSDSLIVEIRDDGRPMHNEALPIKKAVDIASDLDALPEGGFGWFLIHELTHDLTYDHKDGWNCLRFRIPMAK